MDWADDPQDLQIGRGYLRLRRLHLKLYERASRSWRALRLGIKLRSGAIDWEDLLKTHSILASQMAKIGDGLVLPGDEDWENPVSGVEDWQVVHPR